MGTALDDYLAKRPVNRERVEAHEHMMAEVRGYRLRELLEQVGYIRAKLVERIGVGQRQVSKIQNGDLEDARTGTIRSYFEALRGSMKVAHLAGEQRIRVAGRDIRFGRIALRHLGQVSS